MTTDGSVKNTKLPDGPIDFCSAVSVNSSLLATNMTSAFYNGSSENMTSYTMAYVDMSDMINQTTMSPYTTTTETPEP